MSTETIIAWTNHTFNAWMGCTRVSEGCRYCYAADLTKNRMGLDLWGAKAPRQVTKAPWKNVRDWNKSAFAAGVPAKVFCGSLMDWAEDRDDLIEPRARMWQVIRESRHLVFQMLTKRPENIGRFLPADWGPTGYDNVWLGTTIEDNRVAHRAAPLIANPAPVHFVSYEPAIGPLDQLDLTCIEWVIYGGESGPKHRTEDKQWARDMHSRCSESGVAFFHKQSSGWRTELGIELDGKIVREYPAHNYTP
jgi:protein gp37